MTPHHQRIATIAGAALLGLLLLAGGWLLRLPPWSAQVDLGSEGRFIDLGRTEQISNFFGFQNSEQATDGSGRTFRWSSSTDATLTFPYALRMQPLFLDVTLCGCRFDGTQSPVTLRVNTVSVATVSTTDQWRRYRVLLPPSSELPHPDYSLMVSVEAPLWTTPEYRQVGVAVDSIRIQQTAPMPLATPWSTLAVLAAVVVLVWWRPKPYAGLLPAALLGAAWLLLHSVDQPHMLPRPLPPVLLVAGTLALWWLHERIPWAAPWSTAGLLLLAGWLVLSPQLLGHWVLDDAYISFRYAQNLVEGHGLVFNPGERVEGYTNFLWVMLMAAVLAAGGDPLVAALVLGVVLAFAAILLTVALARRVVAAPWAWATAALLAVSSSFLLYTSRSSGMETGLFAVLVLAALLALCHQRPLLAGFLTALTMLTRPDGAVLALAGGAFLLWRGWRGRDRTAARWRWLAPALHYSTACLVLYVPYFLWRWSYYGYLLPNTFYVKVGGTAAQAQQGARYLWESGLTYPLLLAGGAGLLLGVLLRGRAAGPPQHPNMPLIGGFVVLSSLYIILVGGDWMPGARFAMPLLPPLAITTVWGLAALAVWLGASRLPRMRLLSPLLLAGLLLLLTLRLPEHSSNTPGSLIYQERVVVARYREMGRWINTTTPPDTVVAAAAIGALSYYANRPIIDMLGLTDPYIAHLPGEHLGTGKPGHEKSDPAYVLEQQPDIIPRFARPHLEEHPLFLANYRLLKATGPEGFTLRLYVRNDADD